MIYMLNDSFHRDLAALPSKAHERFMRLLPFELHQRVRTDSHHSDEVAVDVHTHLSRLGTALRGAVPLWLLHSFDSDEQLSSHVIDSTILLADVTGFTQLTKQLEVFGRIGNELLTDAINHLFTTLVDRAYAHKGDVLAFSGDGVLIAFTGIDHAANALYAAWNMQAALDTFARSRVSDPQWQHVPLHIKMGLAGGQIVLLNAGNEHRHVALALGNVFHVVDTITSRTCQGTIRLDAATAFATASIADLCQQADGDMLVRGLHAVTTLAPATPTAPISIPLIDLIPRVMDLASFVPNEMLDALVSNPEVAIGDGEQRDVVSMFIHLVGLHELTHAYSTHGIAVLAACATAAIASIIDIIERHGGILARIDTYAAGHKILALFGAPIARERAVERSVYAALALRDQLPSINQCLEDYLGSARIVLPPEAPAIRVSLRIGIQSGQVVAGLVGSPQRWEYTAFGDSINIAARLMASAELQHHEILLGPAVYSQVADIVQAESRQLLLKGTEQPIIAWSVQGLRPIRAGQAGQALPLTGREPELRVLQAAATAFSAGQMTCILVQGEPGIGKTRLVHELPAMLPPESTWIETRALGTAPTHFGSIRALITALCQTATPFDAAQLRAATLRYCPDKSASLWPILTMLMGWHYSDSSTWGTDSETQRRVSAWAVHELLTSVAAQRPLVWLWEDVHDADDMSLALLEHMLNKDWQVPLLWCLTIRPGSASSRAARQFIDAVASTWGDQVMHVTLAELSADASGRLLDALLPGLVQSTRTALFTYTNGNPLFLEVLAQRVRDLHLLIPSEQGFMLQANLSVLGIPSTVRELIAAQIDYLPVAVRHVTYAIAVAAEAAATVPQWLLQQIVARDDGLETILHILEQSLIIIRVETDTKLAYSFRHALYQRTIYDRLLDKERRKMHQVTGQALHTARMDDQTIPIEVLAFHCYEGELWELAALYSLQAGHQALQVYANRNARRFLRRALGLARRLHQPQLEAEARERLGELHVQYAKYAPARAQIERSLARTLAGETNRAQLEAQARRRRQLAIIAEFVGEYAHAEKECRTALALLQDVSPASNELLRIYEQLAVVLMRRGLLGDAEHVCRDGLAALPQEPSPLRERVDLLLLLGTFDGLRGNYHAAIPILEQSLAIARSIGDPARISPILCNLGLCFFYTGQREKARMCYNESLMIDEQIEDAVGRVRTINNFGLLDLMSGEYDKAHQRFVTCSEVAGRLNMRQLLADATSNLGHLYYLIGDYEQAMTNLLQAQAYFSEFGDIRSLAECLVRLGDTALAQGKVDAALQYGEQSLANARTAGTAAHEARALRVIGEALLAQQQVDLAELMIERAQQIQACVDDPFDQALLLGAAARVALRQLDPSKAAALVESIVALAQTYEIPYLVTMAKAVSQELDSLQIGGSIEQP